MHTSLMDQHSIWTLSETCLLIMSPSRARPTLRNSSASTVVGGADTQPTMFSVARFGVAAATPSKKHPVESSITPAAQKRNRDVQPEESRTVASDTHDASKKRKKQQLSVDSSAESSGPVQEASGQDTDHAATPKVPGAVAANTASKRKLKSAEQAVSDQPEASDRSSKRKRKSDDALSSNSAQPADVPAVEHVLPAVPNQLHDLSTLDLDPSILKVLRDRMHIQSFFGMQRDVISAIMRTHFSNDVCISAPTGSGKTLAYALPIVQVFDIYDSCRVQDPKEY